MSTQIQTQTPTPAVTIIGSRNITTTEYAVLRTIAELFHNAGWVLRSGGAHGSDSTINDFSRVEIIIPWEGYNGFFHNGKRIFELSKLSNTDWARTIARTIHPRPSALSSGALKLHTRNIYQIAGPYPGWENADNLSKVVVFCADEEDGEVRGGTRTAVVLAAKFDPHN